MSKNFLDFKQLVPVDWSSEGYLHIGWLILVAALGIVGVVSIVVVVLIVSSSQVAGTAARIIFIIVFVFILIVGVTILTFIIRVSFVGLIDFKFIITLGDINLVNFIHPPCVDGLLSEDVGLKICCFLEGCL